MSAKITDWSTDKLIWYRDLLQKEFDELWEKHEKPLLMRIIGCRLISVMNLIKSREDIENDSTKEIRS